MYPAEVDDGFRFAREDRAQAPSAALATSSSMLGAGASGSSSPSRRAAAARSKAGGASNTAAAAAAGTTRKGSSSSANSGGAGAGAVAYTSTRTLEALPADLIGDTPIVNRNRARRAGLDGLGQPSTSSSSGRYSSGAGGEAASGASGSGGGRRRDSIGLKGMRRRSSLRNGSIAYPHDNVPDHMLYRHCSSAMDPVSRMKFMLAWALNRSVDAVFTTAAADGAAGEKGAAGAKGKGKKGGKAAAAAASAAAEEAEEVAKRKEVEPLLREIMAKLVEDIDEQEVSVSWFMRSGRAGEVSDQTEILCQVLQAFPRAFGF